MPSEHFRKTAIRKRMAETGESYRQAAYAIGHPPVECPGTGPAACPLPDCCAFDHVFVCPKCWWISGVDESGHPDSCELVWEQQELERAWLAADDS